MFNRTHLSLPIIKALSSLTAQAQCPSYSMGQVFVGSSESSTANTECGGSPQKKLAGKAGQINLRFRNKRPD
jgi:hypothetical protein